MNNILAFVIGLSVFCMSFGVMTQNFFMLAFGLAFLITWVFLYITRKEK